MNEETSSTFNKPEKAKDNILKVWNICLTYHFFTIKSFDNNKSFGPPTIQT